MTNNPVRAFAGKHPVLGNNVYVDLNAAVIGDVTLGDDVSVWPMAVIRGDVNAIRIGAESNIQDAAVLHVTHDGPFTPGGTALHLGQGVTVGHQAVLHACHIEDYCLIGIGAIILDQAYIEHHVMIGAGSVVTPRKRLASGFLYLGNPAGAVRKLTEQELKQLEYSARHYVKLKNKYLAG